MLQWSGLEQAHTLGQVALPQSGRSTQVRETSEGWECGVVGGWMVPGYVEGWGMPPC